MLTKSGTGRRAVVHTFHATGTTVFRVQAVDAAGNVGTPSRPFVVVPAVRPVGPAAAAAALGVGSVHVAAHPQRPAARGRAEADAGLVLDVGHVAVVAVPPEEGVAPGQSACAKLGGNTTRPRIDASYAASGTAMNAACQAGCGGSRPSSSDRRKPNRT